MLKSFLDLSFWKYSFLKIFRLTNVYNGVYKDWSSALSKSNSYQDHATLDQIKNASLIGLKDDKFFRDGIVFKQYEFCSHLNILLLNIFIQSYQKKNSNKPISVIDFGGGLGTLYFQFKKYCEIYDIKINFQWNIIEQDDLTKFGKKNIENNNLKFHNFSEIKLEDNKVDLVIFSAVLNYIQDPYFIINKFVKIKPKYILIDRTNFWDGDSDVITILKASKNIQGSYPCYIFSFEKFKIHFKSFYRLKENFFNKGSNFYFDKTKKGNYRGMIWQIK